MRVSDIPSCHRATKGNLIYKSPKSKQILSLKSFILNTQDYLDIMTDQKIERIFIKDYSYSQMLVKPSIITSLKGEEIINVYNPFSLSTSLFAKIEEVSQEKLKMPEKKKEHSIVLDDIESIQEKEVEQIIVEPKEIKEKQFEPISFDDLFKDDF